MDPRLALALSEIDAIVQATPNLTLDEDYLPGFPVRMSVIQNIKDVVNIIESLRATS